MLQTKVLVVIISFDLPKSARNQKKKKTIHRIKMLSQLLPSTDMYFFRYVRLFGAIHRCQYFA